MDTIDYMVNKKNLIIYKYPELVESEWNYALNNANGLDVNKITYGSGLKACWHCTTCKGDYNMIVKHKVNRKSCPYCSGRKVLKGYNDIESQYDNLIASEWDWRRNNAIGLHPSEVSKGSHRKAWWRCHKCNGSYDMVIREKILKNNKCPYCAGKRILPGYNDLASCYPKLISEEWNWPENNKIGIYPNEITAGSNRKAWFTCPDCNGSYDACIYDKTAGKIKCPYCSGTRVLQGFNDLQSKYPIMVKNEWDWVKNNAVGLYPNAITKSSSVKAYWKCSKCKHEWQATAHSRTTHSSGCPKCSHRISKQENQVAEFIRNYLCTHDDSMNHTMYRSIKFKRIYKMLSIDAEHILSDDLQAHMLKELDVYIPDLNLAVEYDGDYWHSDEVMIETRGISNSESHRIKQLLCEQAGLTLLIITEHDWLSDTEDVRNAIIEELSQRM